MCGSIEKKSANEFVLQIEKIVGPIEELSTEVGQGPTISIEGFLPKWIKESTYKEVLEPDGRAGIRRLKKEYEENSFKGVDLELEKSVSSPFGSSNNSVERFLPSDTIHFTFILNFSFTSSIVNCFIQLKEERGKEEIYTENFSIQDFPSLFESEEESVEYLKKNWIKLFGI